MTVLFVSDTWVVIPRIRQTFGGFHDRVARRFVGMHPKRGTPGWWYYPPLEAAMAPVGLEEIDTYVLCHQNSITQYIVTRLILYICLVA